MTALLALALTLAPAGVGAGAGALAARKGAPWWVGAVVMALAAAAGLALALATRVTAWDGAWVGAFVGVGWMAGALAATKRGPQAAMATASALLVLGAGELAARALGSVPPGAVDPRMTIPPADPSALETGALPPDLARGLVACALAFPRALPGPAARRMPPPDDPRPVTLVLGDSMSAGLEPSPAGTWPDQLQGLAPSTFVASAAIVGASVDLHWAALRAWRPLLGPRLRRVVLQLFVNDPMELGRPWDCCDGRPLVTTAGDAARLACDRPRWVGGGVDSWRWRLHASPLPLAVRVVGAGSQLARRLLLAHYRWQTALPEGAAGGAPAGFTAVLRGLALDAEGLDLVAMVVPWRPALDPSSPRHADALRQHRELTEAARAAGMRVIDPTDALRARARAVGEGALFLPNGEHHFSREGHAVIARWAARELGLAGP